MNYKLFPRNDEYAKSYKVNQRFINKNIPLALKRVLKNQDYIQDVFEFFLNNKYNICKDNIFFDIKHLKNQLYTARVSNIVCPWAENREGYINISNWDNMQKEEIISVLIHECIHNSVKIKRDTRLSNLKLLSCDDEHKCLDLLGENLDTF